MCSWLGKKSAIQRKLCLNAVCATTPGAGIVDCPIFVNNEVLVDKNYLQLPVTSLKS